MLLPVRTIEPAEMPVSLEEAKAQCRVDHDDDDYLIEGLIATATQRVDGYFGILGRALIDQEWSVKLDAWPSSKIRLPLKPVSQIISITYWDNADPSVQQTLAAENYALLTDHLGSYVGWLDDADIPQLTSRDDAIEVLFVVGYGADPSDVPQPIRQAILLMVGHWYENRELVVIGDSVSEIPMTADALLSSFRLEA